MSLKRLYFPFLLTLGLGLRIFNFGHYPFNFDQVQILENSTNILSADPTLIGPRTGPASLFTGPLIYYLNALSQLLINSPYSLIITTSLLSLATGLALIFLTTKYCQKPLNQIIPFFWAISPFLINLDRTPWNPNLSLLAASLAFFPLLKSKPLNRQDNLLLASGVFLGYQAHFSGLLLAPVIAIVLLSQHRLKVTTFLYICLAQISTLLPTLLFDLNNDWLNARGVIALLTNPHQVSPSNLLIHIFQVVSIHLQSLGYILFDTNHSSLILTSGLAFLFLYLLLSTKIKTVLAWILTILIVFIFYQEQTPPYYFLIQFPALLYILAVISKPIWSIPTKLHFTLLPKNLTSRSSHLIVTFLTCYAILNTYANYHKPGDQTIASTLKAKQEVLLHSSTQPVSEFVFDMEPVYSVGLRYILKDIPTGQPNGYQYHFITPYQPGNLATTSFSPHQALWIDSRTDSSKNYLSHPQYIIGYPKGISILEDHNLKPYNASTAYLVTNQTQTLGSIYVIPEQRYLPFSIKQFQTKPDSWQPIQIDSSTWYFFPYKHLNFLYQPQHPDFSVQNLEILN